MRHSGETLSATKATTHFPRSLQLASHLLLSRAKHKTLSFNESISFRRKWYVRSAPCIWIEIKTKSGRFHHFCVRRFLSVSLALEFYSRESFERRFRSESEMVSHQFWMHLIGKTNISANGIPYGASNAYSRRLRDVCIVQQSAWYANCIIYLTLCRLSLLTLRIWARKLYLEEKWYVKVACNMNKLFISGERTSH